MRYIKGKYVESIEVKHPTTGEIERLAVWLNPETGKMFALDNMQVDCAINYANDPYEENVGIVFENTFSGLPK
jgi:hypothetical protein